MIKSGYSRALYLYNRNLIFKRLKIRRFIKQATTLGFSDK